MRKRIIMRSPRRLRHLYRHQQGAAAVEYALVAPAFFLIFFAMLEFGLILFQSIALETIVTQAAREATIGDSGSAPDRVTYVRQLIEQKSEGLIGDEHVRIDAVPINQGASNSNPIPITPDICLDGLGLPGYSPCQPGCTQFEEVNGANGFQCDGTVQDYGGGGDMVQVRVTLPWFTLIPMIGEFLGENGAIMLQATTIVKNEPFEL